MKKPGRPAKEPSKAERQKVKDLLAVSASLVDIAVALNRSVPNLRKHFRKELFSGKKPAEKKAPFRITEKMREKVVRYIGCNMSPLNVARVLGCTEDELREFFAEELATGKARYRADVIDELHIQMKAGTSGATNRLEALSAIADPDMPPAAQSPGYIGKKAAAKADAQAAVAGGGKFAPRPAPRLAVDNT